MEEKNSNRLGVLRYLNAVIDENGGLKTKVVVSLSTTSLLQLAITLITAGVTIAFVAHVFKNTIQNKQLTAILNELSRKGNT